MFPNDSHFINPIGSGFGTVSTWISSKGLLAFGILDFPLNAAITVMVLHDVNCNLYVVLYLYPVTDHEP